MKGELPMGDLSTLFRIFCMSALPIFECRISIATGIMIDQLPWWSTMIAAILGNMLPIPFILLFIRKILDWMKTLPFLSKIAHWVEAKGEKNKHKVTKYAKWGLLLFVGIPLPLTGAWTGALVASMLDMRLKNALPAIFAGVVMASVIVTIACFFGNETVRYIFGLQNL